jgi:predicted DNA-binding transcriptional regulator AlpA
MSTKYRRRRHRSERRALTIPQFCRKYRLSRSTYFDMQKRGLGPTEMRITERTIRISPRAEDEWVAKKEAGQSAPVPVFAARPDGVATEVGGNDQTIARQPASRPEGFPLLNDSKHSGRRDTRDGVAEVISRRRNKKRREEDSRDLKLVSRIERPSQSAPKSSANRQKRNGLQSLPRRQKKRSKRAAPRVPKSPSRDDTSGDEAVPRGRKGSSKNRRQKRSVKSQGRRAMTETQPDIIDLKRRLRTGRRLPKDALIESSRWRLDTTATASATAASSGRYCER